MLEGNLTVESLSLSRTEAFCGYPFDFMQPDAYEQDETALYDHRKTLTGLTLKNAIPHDQLPDAEQHAQIVEELRVSSAQYFELQQIVRLLVLFRKWREAEAGVLACVSPSLFSLSIPPQTH